MNLSALLKLVLQIPVHSLPFYVTRALQISKSLDAYLNFVGLLAYSARGAKCRLAVVVAFCDTILCANAFSQRRMHDCKHSKQRPEDAGPFFSMNLSIHVQAKRRRNDAYDSAVT